MVTNVPIRVNGFAAAAICSIIAFTATPAAASGLIYVNRCAAGCTVTPGATDDAINGTSTIVGSTKHLSAFAHSDAVFSDTVVCLRSLFARYDVDIVSANPDGVARREVMLAGTGTELGYPGIPGIAPLTAASCCTLADRRRKLRQFRHVHSMRLTHALITAVAWAYLTNRDGPHTIFRIWFV